MRAVRLSTTDGDTQVSTRKVSLYGYQLYPDGTNAASLVLFNEASSARTDSKIVTAARVAGTESKEVIFPDPIFCDEGIYVDIAGTGAYAFVFIK